MMITLLMIVSQVRKLKSEHQLSLKTEVEKLTLVTSDHRIEESIKRNEAIFKGVTHVKSIAYRENDGHSRLNKEQEKWYGTIVVGE